LHSSGAGGKKPDTCSDAPTRKIVLEKKFKIEFAVDPDFMKKLEEAKALISKKYPCGVSLEQLFEVVLDEFLDKHSPKRKDRRRKKIIAGKKNKSNKTRIAAKTTKNGPNELTRHIPAAVQDRVFKRDNGRFTFIGRQTRRGKPLRE
jgi:hypothetical protein